MLHHLPTVNIAYSLLAKAVKVQCGFSAHRKILGIFEQELTSTEVQIRRTNIDKIPHVSD